LARRDRRVGFGPPPHRAERRLDESHRLYTSEWLLRVTQQPLESGPREALTGQNGSLTGGVKIAGRSSMAGLIDEVIQ